MRLKWQCPTCYAELGDKSHAKMITCPYCGSLLIVNSKERKFYRVPKNNKEWYYFSKVNAPGYIKYGMYEEIYIYRDEKWYLLKNNEWYVFNSYLYDFDGEFIDEGEVSYIWGEIPFIAPPRSIVKTGKYEKGIVKITPQESLLFLKVSEEFPNLSMKLI